jgi:hypothetical protein
LLVVAVYELDNLYSWLCGYQSSYQSRRASLFTFVILTRRGRVEELLEKIVYFLGNVDLGKEIRKV